MGILKKVWSDPVWSKVIANLIWSAPACVVFLIAFSQSSWSSVFLTQVPIFLVYIPFTLFLFSISFMILGRVSRNVMKQEHQIQLKQATGRVSELETKIEALSTTPQSGRLDLFKNRDIVKMQTDQGLSSHELTVIGRRNNKVVVVDSNNKESEISPDALSTVDEYARDKLRIRNEIKQLSMRGTKNYW